MQQEEALVYFIVTSFFIFSVLLISSCATTPCYDCETELEQCQLENMDEIVGADEPDCYEEKRKKKK